METGAQRRLAAMLAADVVGYSRLMGEDEVGTLDALKRHRRELIEPKAAQYNGRTIKLMGDGALMEFGSVIDAVRFAVEVQCAMRERNGEVPEDRRIVFRIGINIGDVLIEDGDIHGDGVNIAARLQELADPGGICIRRNVRNQVRGKLDLTFEDRGEAELKNIARPMRVFAVVLDDRAEALRTPIRTRPARRAPARPGRIASALGVAGAIGLAAFFGFRQLSEPDAEGPTATAIGAAEASIIVLPLDNLSGQPEQNYLANGLSEDITTDLSKLTDLFVVSRNTAFSYAGKAVDPRQISRELGVRYVLEGSVRRVEDTLRINVQLIDGETGGHLWAERYDGSTSQILEFQDDVIKRVVSSLSLRLDPERSREMERSETDDPQAFDAFLQGWEHYIRRTPDDYAEAARHFLRAIEIDPDYGRAYAALASTYWEGWERWWYEPLGFEEWIGPRHAAERYLETALKYPTALAHQVASEVRRQQGRHEDMLSEAQAAVELDPNDPNSFIALTWALTLDGKPEEALLAVERAMALDPHYPAFHLYLRGFVLYMLERYDESAETLERALERNPANFSPNIILIAALARLGKVEEAHERFEGHQIPLSIDWVRYYWRFRKTEDWEHLADGLRAAGVPEVAEKLPPPPKE